jgi:hypothetical protein
VDFSLIYSLIINDFIDASFSTFIMLWNILLGNHESILPFSGEGAIMALRNIANIILYDVPPEAAL